MSHPRSRGGRRLARLVLLVVLAATVSGCAGFDEVFGRREVVVEFNPGASRDDHVRVRSACGGLPHVTAEPLPTDTRASVRQNEVRFDIRHASNPDRAKLYECLFQDPSVRAAGEPGTM